VAAFLRAVDDKATVALVPYGNLDNAKPGASLYACKVAMVWCHEVGTVAEVLPGEVSLKHPHNDSLVRGQMVELTHDRVDPFTKGLASCTTGAQGPQGLTGTSGAEGRPAGECARGPPPTTPMALRQASKRSRMSASQNSMRTGRRRGPFA
jgi:hypothetical protein